jgi:type I restriction enzyme R subunit
MAKRGQQPNMSFFAFTATPKHKTLAIFGRNGEPFPPLHHAPGH